MEINSAILDRLSSTLVDSVWQGVILIAIAFLGLICLKRASAKVRHNFLLVCILALPFWGVYTFYQHGGAYQSTVNNSLSINKSVAETSEVAMEKEQFSTDDFSSNIPFLTADRTHWIAIIWTIGLTFFVIRSLGGFLYLNRLKSRAWEIKEKEWNQRFDQLKSSLGLKIDVLIKESDKLASPLVYGYLKPVILFPAGLIQGLTVEEVEVILLHELAHLKRNDYVINIIINVLRAVYFYHPAFWWLQSQLDNEREFATDEIVMNLKKDNLLFIKALTKTKEFQLMSPALGFAGSSKNQLLKRVNRIMKKQQNPNWLSPMLSIIVLGAAFFLMSQTEINGQEKETIPKNAMIDVDSLSAKKVIFFTTDTLFVKNDSISFTADSISFRSNFTLPTVSPQNDSSKLQQALMEIIRTPSPIEVIKGKNGAVTQIQRNGNRLKGEEFKIYKKAFGQLQKYIKTNVSEQPNSQKERLYKEELEVAQRLKDQSQVLRNELIKLEKELEVAAASARNNEKAKKELEHFYSEKRKSDLERLYRQMISIEKYVMGQDRDGLSPSEIKERRQMIQKASKTFSDAKATQNYFKVLNRKLQMLAGLSKLERDAYQRDVLDDQKAKEREWAKLSAFFNEHMAKGHGFMSFEGDNSLEGAKFTIERLSSLTKKPLIVIDGKSKPDWGLSHISDDDLKSLKRIDWYVGDNMKKKYSKRKIKGRDAVIEITTK